MPEDRRRYHSPRREEQARVTRSRILASPRDLFVRRGYGDTTVEAIAEAAGVSVPTIYATLGSKAGMLLALLDEMAADANIEGMQERIASAANNPRRQLRERVAFNVRFLRRGADLIGIARTVSGVEPELAAMWEEGEARRDRATRSLIAEWDAGGFLAEDVTPSQAVDVLWAFTGPVMFRLFVVKRGWSPERYQSWLTETLEGLLLRAESG